MLSWQGGCNLMSRQPSQAALAFASRANLRKAALAFERLMEPPVIDPDTSVLRGAQHVRIAMTETNLGMRVGFSRVDGLRCNNIIPGNHHDERNVRGVEILRTQSVERALLVQHVEERPAQGERGALVPQQRQFVEASDRVTFGGHDSLEHPQPGA